MARKYKAIWIFFLTLFLGRSLILEGQAPKKWTAGEIHAAIEKLNFLGSALYVAAHPDDENTRMIAYLANEVKAETAYLSLTRGDGGQNLIGPEIREMLGVIRTQELLAARRLDGSNQFFSRANDFGYSKHPEETLRLWNKEEVLSDVVWNIPKWRPDVINNRFDHESAGRTHGHHTSSAILSYEAFDLAGDPAVYPQQLKYVEPWQPRRLFFNTSWWFYGSREAFEQADKSDLVEVDVGVYYPMKGVSNTEIAAASRSMHKSQGFGATPTRGREIEYVKLLKGDMPDGQDLFSGVNTSWSRVAGGRAIGEILAQVEADFSFENPAASVPGLLRAYKLIKSLPEGHWKSVKQAEIEQVIQACLALFAEASADDYSAVPGDSVTMRVEVINRSQVPVTLQSVTFLPQQTDTTLRVALPNNEGVTFEKTVFLPESLHYTTPYWLKKPWELGMYSVEEQTLRGLPETPRALKARFQLIVDGEPLTIHSDVVYKRTDPVAGEVYRPFELVPPIFVNIPEKVYLFANGAPRTVPVVIKAGRKGVSGTVRLTRPEGWRIAPESLDFDLSQKGEEQRLTFQIFPPEVQSEGVVHAYVKLDGTEYGEELVTIDYAHIPAQAILSESRAKVVKVGLQKAGDQIGYIMGAGDEVPSALEQIGYDVTLLEAEDVTSKKLERFDAVILGIRAYNTVDWLKFKQPDLLKYAEEGGTLIVQYNTNRGLVLPMEEVAPYNMQISRDRVTVEEAEMRPLKPEHPILNFPNEITQEDFKGWVQERGLYFPDEWDEDHFVSVFSCNDPGEDPKESSVLVASYGGGYYIYTGLSFFRELPAGVPGAFRLFANMISIGKQERP